MSFDITQKNARCLNNGDRFDELLKEFEGCKWDANLLSEPGDTRKIDGNRNVVMYTWALVVSIKSM